MQESLKKIPFSNELIQDIDNNSSIQSYKTGDVIMRTGQYINNTMLVTKGQLKILGRRKWWRILMYYLQPVTSLCRINDDMRNQKVRLVR
jgi:CRP/FNR family transcriptional regulator